MNINAFTAWQIIAKLPDGLKKWQAFNVANRAAYLTQNKVHVFIALNDEVFDGICDMRNNLHGRTEKISATLGGQDILINAAGGDVVFLAAGHTCEAFIMAEVEVRFGTVISDENFTVLIGAHCAGIDIQVGVQLLQPDFIAPFLQKCPKGS